MSVRAIIYIRVSHDDSKQSGAGEGAQRDGCLDFARRKGWEPVGPFVEDEALKGSTPYERCPALMDACHQLRRGDVLLVFKRDRLSRDRLKTLMFEGMLRTKKCRLVSANGEGTDFEDPTDPMATLYAGLVDLFAEYERLQASFRTRGALQHKRRQGELAGGVPYGLDLQDDGRRSKRGMRRGVERPILLVPNADEQHALALMLQWRHQGWTYRAIAEVLTRKGILTKAGKPWSHSAVHHVLTNLHPLLKHLQDATQNQTQATNLP